MDTSLVGCPRFSVSQAVSSGLRPGTCVVPLRSVSSILDTLTPLFELYVRLRERRQLTPTSHRRWSRGSFVTVFQFGAALQRCWASASSSVVSSFSCTSLPRVEMADRRDWGGGGEDPEESTQHIIERIWESLTDIRMRMEQQAPVPPEVVPSDVEVPVAPVVTPSPVMAAEEPVLQVGKFLRLQPPTYTGGPNPDTAEHWIHEIEMVFTTMRILVDLVFSGCDGYREANVVCVWYVCIFQGLIGSIVRACSTPVSSACHRDREECRVLNAIEVAVTFWGRGAVVILAGIRDFGVIVPWEAHVEREKQQGNVVSRVLLEFTASVLVYGLLELGEFPTEPVTSEAHPYSPQAKVKRKFRYRLPVRGRVATVLDKRPQQCSFFLQLRRTQIKFVNGLTGLNEEFRHRRHAEQGVYLSECGKAKVTTIEEANDLKGMSLENLLGSLMAHEINMERLGESSSRKNHTNALKAAEGSSEEQSEDEASGKDSEDEEAIFHLFPVSNFLRGSTPFSISIIQKLFPSKTMASSGVSGSLGGYGAAFLTAE
ncbi:hypothetical protein Taro_021007 [Colocasia esculenta]|uniref:Uncharacterized protein n=1 Tax=Colocasia esculenta TaxID=4460 RepID=A0A843UXU3_COLES|nr:hypothetical protein [Colocasia esculenta]